MKTSVGKKKESNKASRLEKLFMGLLTERLRIKRTAYNLENSNVASFRFHTDVLGKWGDASCRVGIFAKTIVFMVRTGIPAPEPDCIKCLTGYTTAVNSLYCREWNRFMGRIWFHSGSMVYQLIHLCGGRKEVDRVFVRELLNTAIMEVRRFHEAVQESGFLGHCKEAHHKSILQAAEGLCAGRRGSVQNNLQDAGKPIGTCTGLE